MRHVAELRENCCRLDLVKEMRQVVEAVMARGVDVRLIAISSVGAASIPGADLVLDDSEGRCRTRYGVMANGAAYLLRPDQHVCARWMALDANRLQAAGL